MPDNTVMATVARTLAAGSLRGRVDLDSVDSLMFCGANANYSGSGCEPFVPQSGDTVLGAVWRRP